MLTTKQEFLTTEEIATLRAWIQAPGARLFRKVVIARVQEDQIKATREFSSEAVRAPEDGVLILKHSQSYRDTLKVMDEFADHKTTPYAVKIAEE